MKVIIIAILFMCQGYVVLAKDYKVYYQLVNEAEEAFVNGNTKKTFQNFDRAFSLYEKPFVKDCYIAAQLAYSTGDTVRFFKYLANAFKMGMPVTAYPAAKILQPTIVNNTIYKRVMDVYTDNYKYFNPDEAASDQLEVLSYINDSLKMNALYDTATMLRFIAHENIFRDFIDTHYLSKGMFPSERLFGITSDSGRVAFLIRSGKKPLFDEAAFEKEMSIKAAAMQFDKMRRKNIR